MRSNFLECVLDGAFVLRSEMTDRAKALAREYDETIDHLRRTEGAKIYLKLIVRTRADRLIPELHWHRQTSFVAGRKPNGALAKATIYIAGLRSFRYRAETFLSVPKKYRSTVLLFEDRAAVIRREADAIAALIRSAAKLHGGDPLDNVRFRHTRSIQDDCVFVASDIITRNDLRVGSMFLHEGAFHLVTYVGRDQRDVEGQIVARVWLSRGSGPITKI